MAIADLHALHEALKSLLECLGEVRRHIISLILLWLLLGGLRRGEGEAGQLALNLWPT